MTEPGRGWWIADDHAYTVAEIVETVGRALTAEGFIDVKKNRLRLPQFAGDVAEKIDRFLQRSGRYNQQIHVLGEMNKTIAVDISAARADLGYDPQFELYDGMRRSIRWCLDATGSNCERPRDQLSRHRRERLLRLAARAAARPLRPRGAGSST